jgi:hypothetical protein
MSQAVTIGLERGLHSRGLDVPAAVHLFESLERELTAIRRTPTPWIARSGCWNLEGMGEQVVFHKPDCRVHRT